MGADLVKSLQNLVKNVTVTSRSSHRSECLNVKYVQGDGPVIMILWDLLKKCNFAIIDFMFYRTKEFNERLYVGNTSKENYDEYVLACMNIGFNIDYNKAEKSYESSDSAGCPLYVTYESNNIMRISVTAPSLDETTTQLIPQ